MLKRLTVLVLCVTVLLGTFGCLPADNESGEKPDKVNPKVHIMKGIEYETTRNPQKEGDLVTVTVPRASAAVTGSETAVLVNLEEPTEDYNYYVLDWGDGTWSYRGPYANKENYKVTGEIRHTYKKSGEYQIKACAVNLKAGTAFDWSKPKTVKVSGEAYSPEMIADVTPIGSGCKGEEFGFENVADGDNRTRWQSEVTGFVDRQEYVGYLFDDYYTLDSVEIKFPSDTVMFPSDISIEYTTDGGEIWYMLPHYYYVLPNSEGYYSCVMNFPNPMGATLSLPLDGIAANGLRIKSVRYSDYFSGDYSFSVEEMRVYGRKGTFFYSSYDGYYDADLSNMWTIFGTAKTEPSVYNSLNGSAQNPEPFRSGTTMTSSVEWTAWNGAQLNWSGYNEALTVHANSLKRAVYGGDGWYFDEESGTYLVDTGEYKTNSRGDGFIFATSSAPQHLDAQNHYTNNSTLIIASRDFLLTGNGTEGFLESTNGKGQVMRDKLRKAMDYMLTNLNGRSGLMTIFDPRNDGTVRGLASNYWDSLNFFGYNSAYENILFYRSVLAMADIESFLGNASEADRYILIAENIKTVFNNYFWSEKNGRYITSVNVKGDVLDFGLTFVNFMAVSAGLASEEQAKLIYEWIDGKRIVESDTSKGGDIYNFKVSARSNTVAIETIEEDGLHYWWYNGHSFNDVKPGHWGEYGNQMQNGGTIFYTSYYDILGRTLLSADSAIGRFNTIMAEFHKDSLRRSPRPLPGNYYQVSIVGEFPESGLVPLSFLTGIIGVNPEVKGLKISANLPSDMEYAGVSEYNYFGRKYSIEVSRNESVPSVEMLNGKYFVKVPADVTCYITPDGNLLQD